MTKIGMLNMFLLQFLFIRLWYMYIAYRISHVFTCVALVFAAVHSSKVCDAQVYRHIMFVDYWKQAYKHCEAGLPDAYYERMHADYTEAEIENTAINNTRWHAYSKSIMWCKVTVVALSIQCVLYYAVIG